MKKRLLFAMLVAFCTVAFSYAVSTPDHHDSQMVVSIKVYEEAVDHSKPKVIADLTVTPIIGKPFRIESSTIKKARIGDDHFEIGTRADGKLDLKDADTCMLALKIRNSSAVPQESDPKTDLVRTEILEIRTVSRPGETMRVNCSSSQWCEITVKSAPASDL